MGLMDTIKGWLGIAKDKVQDLEGDAIDKAKDLAEDFKDKFDRDDDGDSGPE